MHMDSIKKLSEDTNSIILAFNYRGIEESSGKANSADDYISDGKAIIDYLNLHEGAKSKDITLLGHSLGAGVAAQVYKELKHKGHIICESSFSTFYDVVREKKGIFLAWLFNLLGWNFNSIEALGTIEDGKLGIIVNHRDPTVDYKVSLYKQLKKTCTDEVLKNKNISIVKIGEKIWNGSEKSTDVKIKAKLSLKKYTSPTQIKVKKQVEQSNFMGVMIEIKKAGWIEYLRHPHQLVMDQIFDESLIKIPEKIQKEIDELKEIALNAKDPKNANLEYDKLNKKIMLASKLVNLNRKFAREDKKAYCSLVELIKTTHKKSSDADSKFTFEKLNSTFLKVFSLN